MWGPEGKLRPREAQRGRRRQRRCVRNTWPQVRPRFRPCCVLEGSRDDTPRPGRSGLSSPFWAATEAAQLPEANAAQPRRPSEQPTSGPNTTCVASSHWGPPGATGWDMWGERNQSQGAGGGAPGTDRPGEVRAPTLRRKWDRQWGEDRPGLSRLWCLPPGLQVTPGPAPLTPPAAGPGPQSPAAGPGSASRCTSHGQRPSPSHSGPPHSCPGAAGPGSHAPPGPAGNRPQGQGEGCPRTPRIPSHWVPASMRGMETRRGSSSLTLAAPPQVSRTPNITAGGEAGAGSPGSREARLRRHGGNHPQTGTLIPTEGPQQARTCTHSVSVHTQVSVWRCPSHCPHQRKLLSVICADRPAHPGHRARMSTRG